MKTINVQNTSGFESHLYIGSHAVLSLGGGNCTFCQTHRIHDNGTVVLKLDDKPNSYKSFKKGELIPFAYL